MKKCELSQNLFLKEVAVC